MYDKMLLLVIFLFLKIINIILKQNELRKCKILILWLLVTNIYMRNGVLNYFIKNIKHFKTKFK